MNNLSENYNLRVRYLQGDQVPTQGMIIKHMTPPLAAVYFKSLTPKLQKIVGLQPLLQGGGGGDWMVDPAELLKGRTVLKPVKKEVIKQLSHKGIGKIGQRLYQEHLIHMEYERAKALAEDDVNWIGFLRDHFQQMKEKLADAEEYEVTKKLVTARNNFENIYRLSISKFESLFNEASIGAINKSKEEAMELMHNKYTVALKTQAQLLYDEYEEKLQKEKAKLKEEFIQKVEIERSNMADKIHDLSVDKHECVKLIEQFLRNRNLACQIYVALMEQEAGKKEIVDLKSKHRQEMWYLKEKIYMKDDKIDAAKQDQKKREDYQIVWQKKICHFVKSFQTFVSYCLKSLPESADFFINLEKLMLLQVNEVMENPSAETIIAQEEKVFHTPVPQPRPFYMFCDKGYKAETLQRNLCPKYSGTSSNASKLPAIIINRRCLYAACDNFEQFTIKIRDYIEGNRGDKADFRDDLIYENFVPVKPVTSSEQIAELKLESSLLQILQDAQTERLPEKCFCTVPKCTCVPSVAASIKTITETKPPSVAPSQKKTVSEDLFKYKWESYFEYKESKSCKCAKSILRQLSHRLPAYMTRAKCQPPDCMQNYEMCTVAELKALVQKARNETPVVVDKAASKTKDIGTKYSDPGSEKVCTCFSDTIIGDIQDLDLKLFESTESLVDTDIHPTYMTQPIESFALDRALSLRKILEDSPGLQDLFKEKCN